jgi:hypothetical protein
MRHRRGRSGRRWAPWAGALSLVLSAAFCEAQESGPLASSPRGPYGGRVVELLTDIPLPDALVIMAWDADVDDGVGRQPVAVTDTLTDSTGSFLIDATEIERTLPARAYAPRLMVYKRGYVCFPRTWDRGLGRPAAPAAERTVIALKPARDAEERAEALNTALMVAQRWLGLDPVRFGRFKQLLIEELRYFSPGAIRNPDDRTAP